LDVEDTGAVKLSLRWKIVGGFGLLLLLIALLGYVTFSLFGSVRDVQRRVFDRAVPQLVAVDEIVRSYTAQSAAVRGYLISSDPVLLGQYRAEVENAENWQEAAQKLRGPSRSEIDVLDSLVMAGSEFQSLVEEDVVPLASDGQRSQAFRVLGQEGTPLIARIESLGTDLRIAQDRLLARSEGDLRAASNNAIFTLIVVTIAAFLIGLFLAITLPRRLVANLDQLVDATRAVERGDLNQQVDIHSGDEVEELANRFGEMQKGLKRLQQLALQDRELEIAASIQRNLLQRRIPEMPGAVLLPTQRQANLVGGDWYDFEMQGSSLSVVVGDASGKGIAAALMATVALSSLRAERGLGAPPRRILERANKALMDATDPESFTTLIYLTLDSASGAARWFNMGHLAPFLLHAPNDDGTVGGEYLDGPRNKAVGWFEDPGFSETHAQLEPGDRLLLFTDGFLEARSADGELYGEHRLAETFTRYGALSPEALVEEVVGEVERFAAGKLDDDLTMLVVEYLGPDRQLEDIRTPAL
jgi:serine phosphatase RsbU (regulator of sigma subunit)/CHASE3 domain sensor protein